MALLETQNTWDGTWTGKDGVNSVDDYLHNPTAQDNAVTALMDYQWSLCLGEGLDSFLGRIIKNVEVDAAGNREDIKISKSGLILGSHIRGVAWLREFLFTQGSTNPKDELGTPIAEYIELGYGYEIPNFFTQSTRKEVWMPGIGPSESTNGYDTPCYISYGRPDKEYDPAQEQKAADLAKKIDEIGTRSKISTTSNWNDGFIKIKDPKDSSGVGYFMITCSNNGDYLPIDQGSFDQLTKEAINAYSKNTKPTLKPTGYPSFKPTRPPITPRPTSNQTDSNPDRINDVQTGVNVGVGVGVATGAAVLGIVYAMHKKGQEYIKVAHYNGEENTNNEIIEDVSSDNNEKTNDLEAAQHKMNKRYNRVAVTNDDNDDKEHINNETTNDLEAAPQSAQGPIDADAILLTGLNETTILGLTNDNSGTQNTTNYDERLASSSYSESPKDEENSISQKTEHDPTQTSIPETVFSPKIESSSHLKNSPPDKQNNLV